MITPIRCGVDTLEATFEGTLPAEFVEDLRVRKELAQSSGEPQELLLGGELFYMQPKGRGFYSYVCRNEDMDVLFGTGALRFPMFVTLSAYGLARRGLDSLWSLATLVAEYVDCAAHNVSRIDIALDFQGWVPTFDEMRNVVCKSDFRPVYPSVDDPQTFQLGKGAVVVRVYDKSRQARDCDKDWWGFAWRLSPTFDATLPVWRAEVQVRSLVLRELGLSSPVQVFDNLDGIFDYGLRWASVRVPGADTNLSRCPEHPEWQALRTCLLRSEPLARIRQARRLASYQSLIPRMRSLIVSAALCLETEDFWTAARRLAEDANMSIEVVRPRGKKDGTYQDAEADAFRALLEARKRKLSAEF